ncbi:MAG: hypothetical protein HOQ05_00760 [Corynebacteriales bacterium]|nr:hypothetical protein [Mycobacteriales bacterium]
MAVAPDARRRRIAVIAFAFLMLAAPASCGKNLPDNNSATKTHNVSNEKISAAAINGPIVIDTPSNGMHVGNQFWVTGSSATFEGIVSWELRYGGQAIDSGTTRGGETEAAPFQFSIVAPAPGKYEIAVFESKGVYGGYGKLTVREVTVDPAA